MSGSVLASDSSSRERLRTSSSTAAAWIGPIGVASRSTGVGEQLGVARGELARQRREEHRLERRPCRGRGRPREASRPPRSSARRRPARLRRRSSSNGSRRCSAAPRRMSVISSGSSRAMRSVGRSLDLVERGALDQPHEPCLGQLLAGVVEARERAPDGCHGRRSVRTRGRPRRHVPIVPPKTAEPAESARRPRFGGHRLACEDWPRGRADRDRRGARARARRRSRRSAPRTWPLGATRSGACWPRTWPAPIDLPPFDSLGDGRLRASSPGPAASCRSSASRAPGTRRRARAGSRARRCASRPGAAVPRGRRRRRAGRARPRRPDGARARAGDRARARTSAAPARTCARASACSRAGTELGPAELGVLAALGPRRAALRARAPRVARARDRRRAGRARASRSARARSATRTPTRWRPRPSARARSVVGRETVRRRRAEPHASALERALDSADVVCVSGGVSVGPHDHVKPALAELGVEERFWGVALKPGKPTWFGTRGDGRSSFGLPGNPVSAMVTFHLFARPALRALAGRATRRATRAHARARRAGGAQPAARPGGARAPRRRPTTAGTPTPTGRAGLARADLDARRRRARARPRRRGRAGRRASVWTIELLL